MNRVVIAGAGGLGREVLAYVADAHPDALVRGFLDDSPAERLGQLDRPWLGPMASYAPEADEVVLVAVGDPTARQQVMQQLKARGARFARLLHPRAYVATSAEIADGAIIAPFAFVGPRARVAAFAFLNTFASAGHDAEVGAFSTLSPYAVLNGHAKLGEAVFVGTHGAVLAGVAVGEHSKIAAGAVVYQPVEPGSLASGNPARARVLYAST